MYALKNESLDSELREAEQSALSASHWTQASASSQQVNQLAAAVYHLTRALYTMALEQGQ